VRISHIEEVGSEYVTGVELRLTAESMLKYGVNRVRGAMWCGLNAFDPTSVPMLQSVIAHILGRNYKEVELAILEQLKEDPDIPPSRSSKAKRKQLKNPPIKQKKSITYQNNTSFSDRKYVSKNINNNFCQICGKSGHSSQTCSSVVSKINVSSEIIKEPTKTETSDTREKIIEEEAPTVDI
jgi:hypothetical protein